MKATILLALAIALNACAGSAGNDPSEPTVDAEADAGDVACGRPSAMTYCTSIGTTPDCNGHCESAFDCAAEPDLTQCRPIGARYCCAKPVAL